MIIKKTKITNNLFTSIHICDFLGMGWIGSGRINLSWKGHWSDRIIWSKKVMLSFATILSSNP